MTTNYENAVDKKTYKSLQDLMGDEGFEEIINFFSSDTKQAISNLQQATNHQQTDAVGGICHKLKSTGKLIGAFQMAELATELEQYAMHKDAALANQLLTQLESEFLRVEQWIDSAAAVT